MKKLTGLMGLLCAVSLTGCDQNGSGGTTQGNETDTGYGYSSTNVGMKPGSGRQDTGGGVSEGDSPERVRSAVSGTATYENPRTNTAGATNDPPK